MGNGSSIQGPYGSKKRALKGADKFKKKDNIVIIGAGPAGVHMASLLKKRGFKNVTILEASHEVGGKSYSIWDDKQGLTHELGTCYMHYLYDPIQALVKEYGLETLPGGGKNETPLGGPSGRFKGEHVRQIYGSDLSRPNADGDFQHGLDFDDWVLARSEQLTLPRSCWCCCDSAQQLAILDAIKRYNHLHEQIFGKYSDKYYGMPPRPKSTAGLDTPAFQWLEKHGLLPLVPLLRYGQQVQGYGVLEEVPIFYVMWWINPQFLREVVSNVINEKEYGVVMLRSGFQALWKAMAQKDKMNIICSAEVTSVTRGGGGADAMATTGTRAASRTRRSSSGPAKAVMVTYVDKAAGGQQKTLECDKVIFAVNMARCSSVMADLDTRESGLFGSLKEYVLATTLYEANPVTHEHPVEVWPSRMSPSVTHGGSAPPMKEGRMYAHRNTLLALEPERFKEGERQTRVAYQFLGRAKNPQDEAKLAQLLQEDLRGVGESGVKVHEQKAWPYFPHWEGSALTKGAPWDVLEMQGCNNSLFIGSSVCFESVLDCVAYNKMLLTYLGI